VAAENQESKNREVRDVDTLQQESPLKASVQPGDYRALNSRETTEREVGNQRHEQNGTLPQTRVSESEATSLLLNPKASSQEKLKAVEALAKAGADHVTIKDADGTTRNCRIEIENSGKRTMVHLHSVGDDGKEHVVLRGVSNGDGTFSHEKDSKGRDVEFTGSWWSKHMSAKSALAETSDSAPTQQRASLERNAPAEMPDRLPDPRRNYIPADQYYEFPPEQQQMNRPVSRQEQYQPRYDRSMVPYSDVEVNDQFDRLASMSRSSGKRMEQLPDGTVYIKAGMAIDADGAPDARRIDPTGQTQTSLRHQDGSSVNAREHPYFVLPAGRYKQYGIRTGDIAAVRYNGKVEFAVFADVGPGHKLGEGSMALAQQLGINNNPRNGGVAGGVEYLVFPQSGNRTPGTPQDNRRIGSQILRSRADRTV
jgi:hypothetical protein